MKIVLWGINYSPEPIGIAPHTTALAEALAAAGHTVRVTTTFPYYPTWRKAPADIGKWRRSELRNGVHIDRCWHYVPARPSSLRRILHEASFVAVSFLFNLFRPAPDLYIVISPPLLLGAAAWLLGWIRRRPFLFHVQDLQPDAARSLGMLPPGGLMRLLYGLEKWAYRHAAVVSGISEGMLAAFSAKGVEEERCFLLPNTVRLPDLEKGLGPLSGQFRRAHGIGAQSFLVAYSGNFGKKQGLDILIDAAAHLEGIDCTLVLCGEGADAERLRNLAVQRGIASVRVLPLLSDQSYQELLTDADLCVVCEQSGVVACFLPSKLLTLLAYAKATLLIADQTSEMVRLNGRERSGGFGRAVTVRDAREIAATIRSLASDRGELRRMGEAGREFVKRYDRNEVFARFNRFLEEKFSKP